jgi:hypothetical protein
MFAIRHLPNLYFAGSIFLKRAIEKITGHFHDSSGGSPQQLLNVERSQ